MGRKLLQIASCLIFVSSILFAQTESDKVQSEKADSTTTKIKSGWGIAAFPILSYCSDLGIDVGFTSDIFNYGKNPSLYPKYRHRYHLEAYHYTKGETDVKFEYDSKYLIPGVRTYGMLAYTYSPLWNFYGFNGDVENWNPDLDRTGGRADYSFRRGEIAVALKAFGDITDKLSWMAGADWRKYDTGVINFDGYTSETTIFNKYLVNGLIKSDEASGGNLLEFRAGLNYDTRDFEIDPRRGCWAELYAVGASNLAGSNYLKLTAHLRGYWTPWKWLTFAGHAAYQGIVAGQQPFYTLMDLYTNNINKSQARGFGGMYSIRGVILNKLLADGYAWGNIEARFHIAEMTILKQKLAVGITPFCDFGAIVQPYRLEEQAVMMGSTVDELRAKACSLHVSPGASFVFVLNTNTVASLDIAKSLNTNDGPLYVAFVMNYLF